MQYLRKDIFPPMEALEPIKDKLNFSESVCTKSDQIVFEIVEL